MNVAKRLKGAYDEYIASVGLGQFSYFRFADWIMENEPDLNRDLLSMMLPRELMRTEEGK